VVTYYVLSGSFTSTLEHSQSEGRQDLRLYILFQEEEALREYLAKGYNVIAGLEIEPGPLD